MRHYEIVLLIHPDQGEHITSTIDNYKKIIVIMVIPTEQRSGAEDY